MQFVQAIISLCSPEEGGRGRPLAPHISCQLFFDDVESLAEHGWDCRIYIDRKSGPIAPGTSGVPVRIAFLSPEAVIPHLRPGTAFRIWESGTIGMGTITSMRADAP